MGTYADILLVAAVTVYAVDLSGFTDSWRGLLSRWLGGPLRQLPPFDCGKCAVFWACLIYAAATRSLTLPVLAWCALLSFLSVTIGQLLLLVREALDRAIAYLLGKL